MIDRSIRVIIFIVWSNFKKEALKNYLGFLWWFLDPLLYCGVFYLVFKNFRENENDFILYLLLGITCWRWISGSIISSARSFNRGRVLLTNFKVNPIVFPLSAILEEFVKYVLIFSVLCVTIYFSDLSNIASLDELILLFITSIVVIFFWSMFLFVLISFFPDLNKAIPSAFTLLLFLSGVIFPIDSVSPNIQFWLDLNPFGYIVHGVRQCFLKGSLDIFTQLSVLFFIHFICSILMLFIISKYQKVIVRRAFEA